MGERNAATRLRVAFAATFLLAGCAASTTSTPAPTSTLAAASPPAAATPAQAVTPTPAPAPTPADDSPTVAGAFYVAPSGNDSNPGTEDRPWRTIQHAADVLTAGQTVYVRAGTYPERVRPTNSGTADSYITYAAYPGEEPLIDGSGVVLPEGQAGLFEIRGLAWIRVVGLHIANAGPDPNSNGIFVQGSHDIILEGNHTEETRTSGIGVWGSRSVVVRANEIVRACTGGVQESLTVAGTDTFVVEDNTVHDTAPQKEGIDAKDGSTHGVIRGNHVFNIPAVGIYVDAWDKPTTDIEVSGNVVRAAGNGIAVASEAGGLLSDVRIVNNVVYDSTWVGIIVTRNGDGDKHPLTDISIISNTVWRNGLEWGGGIALDNPQATAVVVRNNITSDNRSFQLAVSPDTPPSTAIIEYNLVDGYRGDLDDGETYGDKHVGGRPLFADPARGDFHLAEGSPAIDAGSPAGAPGTDFSGSPRPHGAGHDLGAFEYVAPAATVVRGSQRSESGGALGRPPYPPSRVGPARS